VIRTEAVAEIFPRFLLDSAVTLVVVARTGVAQGNLSHETEAARSAVQSQWTDAMSRNVGESQSLPRFFSYLCGCQRTSCTAWCCDECLPERTYAMIATLLRRRGCVPAAGASAPDTHRHSINPLSTLGQALVSLVLTFTQAARPPPALSLSSLRVCGPPTTICVPEGERLMALMEY
jgi:hypothetical protein